MPNEAEQAQRQNAFDTIRDLLNRYELGDTTDVIEGWIRNRVSTQEIALRIRTGHAELPQVRERYKAVFERERLGLPPISFEEQLEFERGVRELFTRLDFPEGFYDSPDDFTELMVKDVSVAEVQARAVQAAAAIQGPPEVLDQLDRMYGIGRGDLVAFWLDPDRAEQALTRRFESAKIAGAAQRATFGPVDAASAERLAALGVTEQEAEAGFGELAQMQPLFQALPGFEDAEEEIGQDEQMGAVFEGNAAARRRIARRQQQRRATFQGGGGFAGSDTGFAGLGDATRQS